MKVIRSRLLGYCHGVSETIDKAYESLSLAKEKNLNCYSIGQLIHNKDVSSHFEKKGLKIIKSPEGVEPGVALIRAHGITEKLKRQFLECGFILEDATCINIRNTQNLIRQAVKENRKVILLGVKGHAETVCIQGTENPDMPGVSLGIRLVSSKEDLVTLYEEVPASTPVSVMVQTTFPHALYRELMEDLFNHYTDMKRGNSLCYECIRRKTSALEMAGECQAIVVLGGKNSENTKELAESIEREGIRVFRLENRHDIDEHFISVLKSEKIETIGVCSGTSTASVVIDGVCEALEELQIN
ncbi:MAG: hypothetical protein K6F82_05035 [Sphaerochaetaceae bacterium]|nr:hypothetical protein [Sphaerochaetaceae bacterium]